MKKISEIVVIFTIVLSISTYVFAHGGSISGWKYEKSEKIINYNGKNYGYHNKDGVRHYHEVKWNDNENRWDIVDSNIYYDKSFNKTTLEQISKNNQETEKAEVKFVDSVDGDTAEFSMNGEIIKVRFLAIDTPESVHPTKEVQAYGIEASNFTKEKLNNAKSIELEFDNNSDKTDKYGRYLAWVWVDGELLQNLLIKEGFGKVAYLYADYKYTSLLQETEKQAKELKMGIWQDEVASDYNLEEENFVDEELIEENTIQVEEKVYNIEEIGVVLLLIIIGILIKIVKKGKK